MAIHCNWKVKKKKICYFAFTLLFLFFILSSAPCPCAVISNKKYSYWLGQVKSLLNTYIIEPSLIFYIKQAKNNKYIMATIFLFLLLSAIFTAEAQSGQSSIEPGSFLTVTNTTFLIFSFFFCISFCVHTTFPVSMQWFLCISFCDHMTFPLYVSLCNDF